MAINVSMATPFVQRRHLQLPSDTGVHRMWPTLGLQGREILPGENFVGKSSLLRKVVKFSPGEILAQQFHPSPQLHVLYFLRRARIHKSAQEMVGSSAFVGALGSSWKTQFWDQVVAMCCNFELSVCCLSCCVVAVIWAYGTWSFGDFKGGKVVPGEIPPPLL